MLKLCPQVVRIRSNSLFSSYLRTFCEDNEKRESKVITRLREEMDRDKQALKWRRSSRESGDIDVKLRLIDNEEQTSDYIVMMQKPLQLNPMKWLESRNAKKEKTERFMQQFIQQRHDTLGPDLATAHFILHRGGSVKFLNTLQWMKANEYGEFKLPTSYVGSFKLEAVKCDNMKLYYEGLENIRWLQNLKFLSFRNVPTFDDWCLDRVSGSQCDQLEILDISDTKCTSNGLSCLYRLSKLKVLIVTNPKQSLEFELSCAMLEEALPNLKIVSGDSIHDVQADALLDK